MGEVKEKEQKKNINFLPPFFVSSLLPFDEKKHGIKTKK